MFKVLGLYSCFGAAMPLPIRLTKIKTTIIIIMVPYCWNKDFSSTTTLFFPAVKKRDVLYE